MWLIVSLILVISSCATSNASLMIAAGLFAIAGEINVRTIATKDK